MTQLTANDLSPRVRKFARFANAMYQTGTVAQANRLIDYAATQSAPGFGRFYAMAHSAMHAADLRAGDRAPFAGIRLPRPQPGDDALLPVAVRDELARLLAWVADDAYRREDISAIARGSHATAHTVYKKGRTIYDQHGRALCRVLLSGADASVYTAIANHWNPPAELYPAPQAGIDAHIDEDDFL